MKKMEIHGLPIIHHDGYVCAFPIKHRFAMRKFHGVLRHLRTDNVVSMKQILKPTAIDPDFLKLVHTPDYVDRFLDGNITVEEQRLTGFKWSTGIVSRCRLETGIWIAIKVVAWYLCISLLMNFVCLFVWGFHSIRKCFTPLEMSPLLVKGYKFWPMLSTHGHWAVRVL